MCASSTPETCVNVKPLLWMRADVEEEVAVVL